MLELASVIDQENSSPNSFSAKGSLPLLQGLWHFALREAKVTNGWCVSCVLIGFSKQVDSLVCFVESEDVDFALLRVMGPVEVSCVNCAMMMLSLPLLTCTT